MISGTRLRDQIVGVVGERTYLGLFALSSLGAIIWLCIAYNHFYRSAENRVLCDLGQNFRNLAIPVVSVAFLLGVPGVMMANPTSAGQSGAALRGVLRITRHPFLWGVAIWSGYHLAGIGRARVRDFLRDVLGARALRDTGDRRQSPPQAPDRMASYFEPDVEYSLSCDLCGTQQIRGAGIFRLAVFVRRFGFRCVPVYP